MYFWRSARVLACPCSLNFHPPLKVTTWLLHPGLLSWYLYNIDVSFGGNALRLEYSPVTSEHVVISPSCPIKSFYLLYRLTSFLTSLSSFSITVNPQYPFYCSSHWVSSLPTQTAYLPKVTEHQPHPLSPSSVSTQGPVYTFRTLKGYSGMDSTF